MTEDINMSLSDIKEFISSFSRVALFSCKCAINIVWNIQNLKEVWRQEYEDFKDFYTEETSIRLDYVECVMSHLINIAVSQDYTLSKLLELLNILKVMRDYIVSLETEPRDISENEREMEGYMDDLLNCLLLELKNTSEALQGVFK
ncbi:hypothetical protein C0J52_08499 [Blattella germanica]|nr:hypothetical protein C0J52_08499 [Blattella germanica]